MAWKIQQEAGTEVADHFHHYKLLNISSTYYCSHPIVKGALNKGPNLREKWFLFVILKWNIICRSSINIAPYLSPYHPYIFQNVDIPEGIATTTYCTFPFNNIRSLSSAGGQLNNTEEEKEKCARRLVCEKQDAGSTATKKSWADSWTSVLAAGAAPHNNASSPFSSSTVSSLSRVND